MNILLNLDGVLSTESGEPILAGVVLYYALNSTNRVAIMTSRSKEDAEHWLQSHGIINYDDLVDSSMHLEGDDLKQRQFKMSRSKSPVGMYIDSDPAMCAWVFEEQNVPTVLLSHPGYTRVEHRPDAPKKFRTWDQIVEAVDRVNLARAKDRMTPTNDIGEYSD